MPYCTGKHIEKSRGKAMKMLVIDKKPVEVVADRFGVHRSTIWRWRQKWLAQNHIELTNPSRRKYLGISSYKYELCKWSIPSFSTAPKSPHALSDDVVQLVLDIRDQLKRYNRMNKPKNHRNRRYKDIKRPKVLMPGDLVEIDTIHLYNPITKQRRYIYTVIDLYTRMAYARVYKELKPINSLNTIEEAKQYLGFKFKVVQSDNGLEFSNYFSDRLEKRGIKIRHTRLGRPNDNAHIERFNRTLQEECTGNYYLESESLKKLDDKILSYIDYYNYHRIHLGISYRTPSQMLHRL